MSAECCCSYNPAAGTSSATAGLGLDLDSIQQLGSQAVDQDGLQVCPHACLRRYSHPQKQLYYLKRSI